MSRSRVRSSSCLRSVSASRVMLAMSSSIWRTCSNSRSRCACASARCDSKTMLRLSMESHSFPCFACSLRRRATSLSFIRSCCSRLAFSFLYASFLSATSSSSCCFCCVSFCTAESSIVFSLFASCCFCSSRSWLCSSSFKRCRSACASANSRFFCVSWSFSTRSLSSLAPLRARWSSSSLPLSSIARRRAPSSLSCASFSSATFCTRPSRWVMSC
mmetsp:Transcript_11442/g.35572  ORF Transcript_11442/g.35572 Transcript_11442/m.35572 type:complete len:216 (-) Transcript_11442:656-1303(-)